MRNDVKNRVKEHFFRYPTRRLRVRQIEKEAKTPLPSTIRYSKELEKEHILKSITISGIRFYTAARGEESYLLEKRLHNLKNVHVSGLIETLKEQCGDVPMILFGSYEKGEDVEDSDIDIFIQTKKKDIKGLDKYEKYLGRGIQIFTSPTIRLRNKELANNIINGTRLNRMLEVV